MKTRITTSSLAAVLGSVSSVFAASGAREDNSGILVWLFLGMCALIVLLQLMPALLTMIGMAKGVADSVSGKHEAHAKRS